MKKTIAVIGLGRFGINLVEDLSKLDVEVIAVDSCEVAVAKAADYIRHAYICDSSSEHALKEIGISEVDHAIIAFGQNDEKNIISSITTTIMLKKLGVKNITVRLDDEVYAETLKAIGATSIIFPSKIASERSAMRYAMDNIVDYFKLSGCYHVFEVSIPTDFNPVSLLDLDSRKAFQINILMIRRGNDTFTPNSGDFINPGDSVFVFGKKAGVEKFSTFIKH